MLFRSGQEPAYQVQAVKYKYLKPLVESLEVQLNGLFHVGLCRKQHECLSIGNVQDLKQPLHALFNEGFMFSGRVREIVAIVDHGVFIVPPASASTRTTSSASCTMRARVAQAASHKRIKTAPRRGHLRGAVLLKERESKMNLGAFMNPEYPIFSTTLCYLERDDATTFIACNEEKAPRRKRSEE